MWRNFLFLHEVCLVLMLMAGCEKDYLILWEELMEIPFDCGGAV
jgi:hypothetical protein